jgi:hypothetical protein
LQIDNPHQTDLVVNIMQWRLNPMVQSDILPHHPVHLWYGEILFYLRWRLWDESYHLQAKIARDVNDVVNGDDENEQWSQYDADEQSGDYI